MCARVIATLDKAALGTAHTLGGNTKYAINAQTVSASHNKLLP